MSDARQRYDAVVVGSGFGGSINALRLSEKGRSVLVLERGRRYRPGEFPRDVRNTEALFWRYPERSRAVGLYDVRFFSGLSAIAASGVGGGSLIYANIHIRPDPIVFQDERWPAGYDRERLDPYYDRVARMLGVAPVPPEKRLAKRDVFRRAAAQMQREVFDPDEAVTWTGDPGSGRRSCQHCAECEFGCQYGAKNTLDFTYLAAAERLGAQVLPRCNVSHVEPLDGGYRVHFRDLQTGEARHADGRRVVLSAGTLGSTEILLRSRDETRTLPNLSARLGQGYSGNGDFTGSIVGCREELSPWEGPDVTSVMRFFDQAPGFTLAAPAFNQRVMEALCGMGQPKLGWLRWMLSPFWPLLQSALPWAFERGLFNKPRKPAAEATRMTNAFAIGRDNANGRMALRRGRLDIQWNYSGENQALIQRMIGAMQALAAAYGGTFAPSPTWTLFGRIFTVHSLGGCHLADSPEKGVVSPQGEVFQYPGLFVADGSVIPTSIGFHPVMTISAVAERIAETVAQSC